MRIRIKALIYVFLIFFVSVGLFAFAYLEISANQVNNETSSNNPILGYSNDTTVFNGQPVPTITVTMKPSVDSGLPYKEYTRTWVNYCPFCHKMGTLTDTPKDPSRTGSVPEGEITCDMSKGGCDADYDGVTGKDKLWRTVFLIPADTSTMFSNGNGNFTILNDHSSDQKMLARHNQEVQLNSTTSSLHRYNTTS